MTNKGLNGIIISKLIDKFCKEQEMAVSYKKLWKLLIDKDMKKEDLRKATGITTTAMAKLGRNENVNTEILVKICVALQCELNDIVEIVGTEQ